MIDDENEVFTTDLGDGVSLTIYEPIEAGEAPRYRVEFIHACGVNWFFLSKEECRLLGGVLSTLGRSKH